MTEASTSTPPGAAGGICVFSGGTAANFLVDVFDQPENIEFNAAIAGI